MFKISLNVERRENRPSFISIEEASKKPGFYHCVGRPHLYYINDAGEVFLLLDGNLYISDINPSEIKKVSEFTQATEKIVFKMEN